MEQRITTLCVYGNGLISEFRGDIHLYHHYNHLSSTMKLTDGEGSTVASYAYGTYGELLSGNAGITRFLYNGSCGVSTDANGLYYMRQRYYNPETKRFLNQDILTGSIGNSQSLNRYSYVQGNPVNSTDPFGLSPLNMMEGTGLIHGILGLVACVAPGPVGAVASLVDAGIYCFVDHDYGMAALSFVSSVGMGAGSYAQWVKGTSGAARTAAEAAKAAKVARTAEYARSATTFVSNTLTFATGGINLWRNSNDLYQKYKAGEKISLSDVATVALNAATCVVAGAGMVKEAKNLGKMMKEDNVVGRLKESVGRFGSGFKQSLRSGGGSGSIPTQEQMHSAVTEWARMEEKLANSKTQLSKFNTATVVYDSSTGNYYYGMNRGMQLSGDNLNPLLASWLPEESMNGYRIGNCAEVDAVNQALNNGANVSNLYLYTINTKQNIPKEMCENCIYTFLGRVADVLSH